MAVPHAHLLLQCHPGRSDAVAAWLTGLPAVRQAAVTDGAYDVVAVVDLSEGDLSHVLVQARRAPGLSQVRVCLPAGADASARPR